MTPNTAMTQWRLALRKVLAAASVSLSAGSPKSSSLLAGLSRKREPGELCDETCRQAKQMIFSFSSFVHVDPNLISRHDIALGCQGQCKGPGRHHRQGPIRQGQGQSGKQTQFGSILRPGPGCQELHQLRIEAVRAAWLLSWRRHCSAHRRGAQRVARQESGAVEAHRRRLRTDDTLGCK